MSLNKFRRGETTYTCSSCKKLTRNSGGDERACGLCLDCFDLAGIDNHLSDNGAEEMRKNYGDEAAAILKRRPELKAEFPNVAAAVEVAAPEPKPAKPKKAGLKGAAEMLTGKRGKAGRINELLSEAEFRYVYSLLTMHDPVSDTGRSAVNKLIESMGRKIDEWNKYD